MRSPLTCRWFVAWLLAACCVLTITSRSLTAEPPSASVSHPLEKEVQDAAEFAGHLEAAATVPVRSRVVGFVDKVLFEEGSLVKKGDTLFQIDDQPYRARVDQAEAEVARATARLKIAELTYQRTVELVKKGAAVKEDVEKADAEREEAKAVQEAATANRAIERLTLSYTRITAPMDGRIGRALVPPGHLVNGDADRTNLATIVSVEPLRVFFDIDEMTYLRFRRQLKEQKLKDAKVSVNVRLAGEQDFSRKGVLDFAEPQVDAATGTLRLRGTLPDPERELRPGMFVSVRITVGEPRKALLVPDDLVTGLGLKSVLVVNEKDEVERRTVKTGELRGGMREVEKGLTKDDWVIVEPHALKVGSKITPQRKEMPEKAEPAPNAATAAPPPPDFPAAGPAVVVTASYPGANARTLREAVAAPIEQQFEGLEGLVQTFTACSNSGELRMTLLLKEGTDLKMAQFLAQNRVSLAMPVLPDIVQYRGVSVLARATPALGVAVYSPDGSRDRAELVKSADQLRNELRRVGLVGDVRWLTPPPEPEIRLDLDRARLAALGLTVKDIDAALRAEEFLPDWKRPARNVENLKNLTLKTDKEGRSLFLRDVARIEIVRGFPVTCDLNGRPCVVLQVDQRWGATAAQTSKAVQARLNEIAKDLPNGLTYRVFPADR